MVLGVSSVSRSTAGSSSSPVAIFRAICNMSSPKAVSPSGLYESAGAALSLTSASASASSLQKTNIFV